MCTTPKGHKYAPSPCNDITSCDFCCNTWFWSFWVPGLWHLFSRWLLVPILLSSRCSCSSCPVCVEKKSNEFLLHFHDYCNYNNDIVRLNVVRHTFADWGMKDICKAPVRESRDMVVSDLSLSLSTLLPKGNFLSELSFLRAFSECSWPD